MESRKTIALDFDGVIHRYSQGWRDGRIYDPPMDGAQQAIERLNKEFNLVIFTARTNLDDVKKWLKKYNLDEYFSKVTNKKPCDVEMYVDDLALHFTNWKDAMPQILKEVKKSISIFGKALKTNNPNQMNLFVTAGTEKDFGPEDRRRLQSGQSGKLRWHKTKEKAETKASEKPSFEVGERVIFTNVNGKEYDVNYRGLTSDGKAVIVGKSGSGIDQMIVDLSTLKKKPIIKDRNKVQLEILMLAEIPEDKIADYALDSYADGKKLGEYAEKVMAGSMSVEDAGKKVKADYNKMASGEKEAPNVQEKPKRKWYHGINKDNKNVGDKFYSEDKEVAAEYSAMDSPGERGEIIEIDDDDIPKNLYETSNKEELGVELGLWNEKEQYWKVDPFHTEFDERVKNILRAKGYAGIKYFDGTSFEANPKIELHVFGPPSRLEELRAKYPHKLEEGEHKELYWLEYDKAMKTLPKKKLTNKLLFKFIEDKGFSMPGPVQAAYEDRQKPKTPEAIKAEIAKLEKQRDEVRKKRFDLAINMPGRLQVGRKAGMERDLDWYADKIRALKRDLERAEENQTPEEWVEQQLKKYEKPEKFSIKAKERNPLIPVEIKFVPTRYRDEKNRVKAIAVELDGDEHPASSADIGEVIGKPFFQNETDRIPYTRLRLWLDDLISDYDAQVEADNKNSLRNTYYKKFNKSYRIKAFARKLFKASRPDIIEGEIKMFGPDDMRVLKRTPSNKLRYVDYGAPSPDKHISRSASFKIMQRMKEIKSEPFKKWFGDWESYPDKASKIVDKRGRPLVVYRADDGEKLFTNTKDSENATEVYLDIRNPYEYEVAGDSDPAQFIENNPYIIEQAKKDGYDGVMIFNLNNGKKVFTVLNQYQIKSATDNRGEFSRYDDDITKGLHIKAFGKQFFLRKSKKERKPLMKALGEQTNMFESGPYSREGQTKPGKGGTLQLKRDKTGKGAHWTLLDKKQSEGRSKGNGEQPSQPLVANKVINNQQAYDLLSDKLGNKATVIDSQGNPMSEGKFTLINENSDGTSTLFFKDQNGQSQTISIPANQAIMQQGDGVVFQFADRKIAVSLTEKVEDQQNINPAAEQREAEKRQEWDRMADNYIREAKAQMNPYLQDLDEVSKENGLEEISHTYRQFAIKGKDSIINKFERNEAKGRPDNNRQLTDILRGTIVINNPGQYNAIMSSLEKKGYKIWNNDITNLFEDKKPGYKHIAVKLTKGEGDPVIKELIMITPKMYEAKRGFGHSVYDIDKNVDIMLGSKINESHHLYPEVVKFKQALKDITNKFYMRAYKADVGSDSDSAADSKAEPETNASNKTRKSSLGYSAPPKRMIRALRSSLKTLLQQSSARLTNSSGDMFNLADSSEAISSTLGSIVNPTKNVVKMFASKVVNLWKSNNKNVIIREGNKMNIFKAFGKLFKSGEQMDLFTGQDKDGKKLLPSKKNPQVRRYQKTGEDDKKPTAFNKPLKKEDQKAEPLDYNAYYDSDELGMTVKVKQFSDNIVEYVGGRGDSTGLMSIDQFNKKFKKRTKEINDQKLAEHNRIDGPDSDKYKNDPQRKEKDEHFKKVSKIDDIKRREDEIANKHIKDITSTLKGEKGKPIAEEIAKQLGNKTFKMLGAKDVMYDMDGSLSFKIQGSQKYRHIKIAYDQGKDLYNLTFTNYRGNEITAEDTDTGVYADQLHEIIEKRTGLYTSLGTMGREKKSAGKEIKTEADFSKNYQQHKMLRPTAKEDLAKIREEGFRPDMVEKFNEPRKPFQSKFSMRPNVSPVKSGKEAGWEAQYQNKKGDIILFVPQEAVVEGKNGNFIKPGWKPRDYEIGVVEYDNQPSFEIFNKNRSSEDKLEGWDKEHGNLDEETEEIENIEKEKKGSGKKFVIQNPDTGEKLTDQIFNSEEEAQEYLDEAVTGGVDDAEGIGEFVGYGGFDIVPHEEKKQPTAFNKPIKQENKNYAQRSIDLLTDTERKVIEGQIKKRRMEINMYGGGMNPDDDPQIQKLQNELNKLKG